MKKITVLALGLMVVLGFSGCIKDEDPFDWQAQYELEKPDIEAYATNNFDNPQIHETTGIWYEIIDEGEPDAYEYKARESGGQIYPEAPIVTVTYTGRLLNGTVFGEDEEAEINFNNTIGAWVAVFFPEEFRYDLDGEPLPSPIEYGGITATGLEAGAVVRFVTPSYLAYGNRPQGSIPANSPLVFEIEVHNIEAPQ